MNQRVCSLFAILLCSLARPALAQDATIRFQNDMQAVADVKITPVGGGSPVEFALGTDNSVEFSFRSDLFDIQVIPRDNPDSGFRFQKVNLRDVASRAQGNVVRLRGEFEGATVRVVCCGRRFRRRCYSILETPGERVAVTLNACLLDGGVFDLRSPKMPYAELIKP